MALKSMSIKKSQSAPCDLDAAAPKVANFLYFIFLFLLGYNWEKILYCFPA